MKHAELLCCESFFYQGECTCKINICSCLSSILKSDIDLYFSKLVAYSISHLRTHIIFGSKNYAYSLRKV